MRDQSISASERDELIRAAHIAFVEGGLRVAEYQRRLLDLGFSAREVDIAINVRLREHMANACKGR